MYARARMSVSSADSFDSKSISPRSKRESLFFIISGKLRYLKREGSCLRAPFVSGSVLWGGKDTLLVSVLLGRLTKSGNGILLLWVRLAFSSAMLFIRSNSSRLMPSNRLTSHIKQPKLCEHRRHI